jgi:Sec-independent protein secretion pathway component TatC
MVTEKVRNGQESGDWKTYLSLSFVAYFLGFLYVIWLEGDFISPFKRWVWKPLASKFFTDTDSYFAYALFQVLPQNVGILLVAGFLLPLLTKRFFRERYDYVRPYGIVLAFLIGAITSPGFAPQGLAYTLKVLPTSLLEVWVFTYATYEGIQAQKQERFPKLGFPLLLLVLSAFIETGIIFWWL